MAKQPHGEKCGAKTRSGNPCKNPAGFRTDHVGIGKCYLHGGKSTGPPKKNKNAEKHGFFSKHLPKETMDIVDEIKEVNLLDILWNNIKIQYAAIIRSQKIMYVESKEEMIKELKKEKVYESDNNSSSEIEYEFQFSWDRQATFLQAQSRAMTTLQGMIKRYEEMLKSDLATEEQKLRIQKLKAEIEESNEDVEDWVQAIRNVAEKRKGETSE